ncbi:MAG: hypothetical protein FWG87_02925 [Defluviitaleaceae bacterium]|nr:hypothetical protein [Defluviitaleaceae bacterium]
MSRNLFYGKRTLVNSGRITSIKQAVRCCLSGFLRQHRTPTNAELGNLGTDKSVPYKNPANVSRNLFYSACVYPQIMLSFFRILFYQQRSLTP